MKLKKIKRLTRMYGKQIPVCSKCKSPFLATAVKQMGLVKCRKCGEVMKISSGEV